MNTLEIVHILPSERKITVMEYIIPVVASIFGAIFTAIFYRSLTEAKVKSIIAETYDRLVETLQGEVTSLRQEVHRLQDRLDLLSQKEIQYLTTIAESIKERNNLALVISEKDSRIIKLEKQILELQKAQNERKPVV